MGKMLSLQYDQSKWQELIPRPVNTLQLFITNKCNNRCKACFYAHKLGSEEMSFDDYKKIYAAELGFRSRKCNKHTECLLQKIVLERV